MKEDVVKRIVEEKSINSDIVNLSDLIADKILKQAPLKQTQISKINGALFVEGEFIQNVYGEIKGINELTVHYILYRFENKGEYRQWLRTVISNDESEHYNNYADYNEKYIQIVSGYIGDIIMTDFAENILHEITHLYQYGMGLKKRVNLYDAAVILCRTDNEVAQAVGRTVYYTFAHEQDAMVHQFYGNLLQTKTNERFEDICENNTEYGNALDYLYIVNNNKEEAKQYIKRLGFTIEQYNKRIYFGYKRFKQKLYNAYLFYNSQKNKDFGIKNESKTFEINLSKQAIFDKLMNEAKSKYGKIVYGIEKFYLVESIF